MIRIIVIILIFLNQGLAYGQNQEYILDSLKSNSENQVIVFKSNCVGCIVMNKPCEAYIENENPWNQYIIWKNSKGYFVKKFNTCGSSNILAIKRLKVSPFDIVESKTNDIDTTNLKYPLSFNEKDSSWFETGVNHYKYYEFSFPSYNLRDVQIKDYAFRESKKEDEIRANTDKELQQNQNRYTYNNSTAIKELLDCILLILKKEDKKLEIK